MGESGGNAMGWSVELCGGTMSRRTGDIGLFSMSGGRVAAGVRRLEALTGTAARKPPITWLNWPKRRHRA